MSDMPMPGRDVLPAWSAPRADAVPVPRSNVVPLPVTQAAAAVDSSTASGARSARVLHSIERLDGFDVEVTVREEAAGGYSGTVTVSRPAAGPGTGEVVFSNGLIVHKSRFPTVEAARSHALEVGRYAIHMFQ